MLILPRRETGTGKPVLRHGHPVSPCSKHASSSVVSTILALDLAVANPPFNLSNHPTHIVFKYRRSIAQEVACPGRIEAKKSTMGFFVISLYFVLMGLVGTLGIKVCYNKGPSTNMLNVVLVNTAVICCWLMWAIVWLAQWKPLINPILKAEGE